ncbi:MAG TPA: hypothetical protein VHN17_05795 [Steroidobacteraceae bacterium]|jgi:hypothetical protein|nr:hypothetical protein [Steroidobacteraceae bacterium]
MFVRSNISGVRKALAIAAALLPALQPITPVLAGPNEQAERLFGRITGSEPSAAVLTQMSSDISGSNAIGAAQLAMQDPSFYNVTLRNFAAPMTNKAQSVFVPLNDYTATIIGMIRDNVPFNTVLSADLVYTGNVSGAPAYSPANNNHYQYLDTNGADLSKVLVQQTQSALVGIPSAATAGVMTTLGGASAFFYKGTNRAMVRFTLINYMCDDLNTIMDITRPPDRIRQDPSRSPGGDSRVFLNTCIGCHSGMDALAGAFAYYEYNVTTGQMVYTPGQVQGKYAINTGNFPYGHVTIDDSWINYWRSGPNALLGWNSSLPGSGNGAKSFGQEIESSAQFATCQVQKVFQAMCLRPPSNAADRAQAAKITSDFVSSNYNMKTAFAESAVYCMGQ